MAQSKFALLFILAACLPLHAEDERERQDIARELHRIATLSGNRPPSDQEIKDLGKFNSRELTDMRRSLEVIRRSMESGSSSARHPSTANGGTSNRSASTGRVSGLQTGRLRK